MRGGCSGSDMVDGVLPVMCQSGGSAKVEIAPKEWEKLREIGGEARADVNNYDLATWCDWVIRPTAGLIGSN